MNSMNINGSSYNFAGRNVSIQGNKVIVNGVDITNLVDIDAKEIIIIIESPIDSIDVEYCHKIKVKECNTIKTMSGSVYCDGDIKGSVNTMSGSVRAEGSIGGSVSTMSGNIRSIK